MDDQLSLLHGTVTENWWERTTNKSN